MEKYCHFSSANIYWKVIPDAVLKHIQECHISELAEYDAEQLEKAVKIIRMRISEESEKSTAAMFEIEITYFKHTGKFYSSEKLTGLFETLKEDNTVIYMYAVVDWIKDLRKKGELPGLSLGNLWLDGYIIVDCKSGGFPCLILPHLVGDKND